jgi:hypothetical protein
MGKYSFIPSCSMIWALDEMAVINVNPINIKIQGNNNNPGILI